MLHRGAGEDEARNPSRRSVARGLAGAALAVVVGLSSLAIAQTGYGPPPTDPTEEAPPAPTGPAAGPAQGEGGAASGAEDQGGGEPEPMGEEVAAEEEPVAEEPVEPAPPPAASGSGGGDEDALQPSSRPWIAEFGIGPSIFMLACARGRCQDLQATTQVKMSQFAGYHLSGDGEGFGIGLGLNEAFGSGLFRFQPGLRLFADIPLLDGKAVYVSPYAQLGYSLYTASFGGASGSAHFFNWQLGAAARVVLGDRFSLSFTPIGFDWVANGDGMIWVYDLAFGFGATF